MNLREKFAKMVLDKDIAQWESKCVEIADEHAVNFTDWLMINCELSKDKSLYSYDSEDWSLDALLKIYKKEKAL